MTNSEDYRVQILVGTIFVLALVVWGWIKLPSRFKRRIGLTGLGITLLVGLIANVNLMENPPTKITAYYQEHGYSYDTVPNTITDTAAMWTDLVSINLAVIFAGGICLLVGGVLFPSLSPESFTRSVHRSFVHLPIQAVAAALIDKLSTVKESVSKATVLHFQKSGTTEKVDRMSRHLVRFPDLIVAWGTSPNIGRNELLRHLYELGLEDDDFVEKLATAVHSRYGAFLYKNAHLSLSPILFQAEDSTIAPSSNVILKKICSLLQEGKSEMTAVWEGLSEVNGRKTTKLDSPRTGANLISTP